MSKKNKATSPPPKPTITTKPISNTFSIPYPILWLIAVVVVLYAGTIHYDFTQLDDAIFIKEMQAYNESLSNLVTSFSRGVFNPTNDEYYRPMFLNSMILNYQFAETDIVGYHVFNIGLHILCVILFYQLLLLIEIKKLHAFLLSLLFAVHPSLSQAVVWIPGRNDSLMGVFVLSYILCAIRYSQTQHWNYLVGIFVFLSASFFTKESAIVTPAVAVLIQVFILKQRWFSKSQMIHYGIIVIAVLVYFGLRSTASLKPTPLHPADLFTDFTHRIPIIFQYLGKVFFPFNLSVFPIQEDTVIFYGLAAMLLLIVAIAFTKEKRWNWYIAGLGFFFVYLLPLLFLPKTLNEQIFEHRLYLPMMGLFLVLPQTILFKNTWSDKQQSVAVFVVAGTLFFLNYRHQPNFENALSFWKQAYTTSPHSAYATMMYGARVEDRQEGYALMRQAYKLNPDEKYLNYYYGMMLQNQDSLLASEPHFLREKKKSGYYECDFYLAKIAFYKKDFKAAATYLETYVKADPTHDMANKNLLLLYVTELKDKQKALAQIKRMETNHIMVNQELKQQINSMP